MVGGWEEVVMTMRKIGFGKGYEMRTEGMNEKIDSFLNRMEQSLNHWVRTLQVSNITDHLDPYSPFHPFYNQNNLLS